MKSKKNLKNSRIFFGTCAQERVRHFVRKYLRIPERRFYQMCGLSAGFLTNNNNMGSGKLNNICRVFPELNLDWVVMGTGSMLRFKYGAPDALRFPIVLNTRQVLAEPTPAYGDNDAIRKEEFYTPDKTFEDCDAVYRVLSNDMTPHFLIGDIVFLKALKKPIDNLRYGDPYLIIKENIRFFRKVYKGPRNTIVLRFSSEKRYNEVTLRKKDIETIYEVRGLTRVL